MLRVKVQDRRDPPLPDNTRFRGFLAGQAFAYYFEDGTHHPYLKLAVPHGYDNKWGERVTVDAVRLWDSLACPVWGTTGGHYLDKILPLEATLEVDPLPAVLGPKPKAKLGSLPVGALFAYEKVWPGYYVLLDSQKIGGSYALSFSDFTIRPADPEAVVVPRTATLTLDWS